LGNQEDLIQEVENLLEENDSLHSQIREMTLQKDKEIKSIKEKLDGKISSLENELEIL